MTIKQSLVIIWVLALVVCTKTVFAGPLWMLGLGLIAMFVTSVMLFLGSGR